MSELNRDGGDTAVGRALAEPALTSTSSRAIVAHSWQNPIHFAPTSRVEVDGVMFKPRGDNDLGHELERLDSPGVIEFFRHGELAALGDRVREHVDADDPAMAQIRKVLPSGSIRDLPPKARRVTLYRDFMLRQILPELEAKTAGRSDDLLKPAIDRAHAAYMQSERACQTADGRCGNEITTMLAPSPRSVRRWLGLWEAMGYETMALCPAYGRSGNSTPRFEAPERRILKEVAATYADRRKPSRRKMLEDLRIRIREENETRERQGLRRLVCPGRKALNHQIDQLDPYHTYAAREGEEKARKRFMIVNGGLDVAFPLERVEMDDSLLPLQLFLEDAKVWETMTPRQREFVARERFWLSTCMDARTRCWLALRLIRNPSALEAVATLEMAVNDKTAIAEAAGCKTPWDMAGRPFCVDVDNGSSYLSHEFRGSVTDLRSGYMFGPASRPQMRGREERGYRTINQQFVEAFDGRTFEDVVRKGEYDSEGLSTVNVVEIGQLLVRYVVDVYHNKPHKGLGGETPRNCWLRLERQFKRRLPPHPDENRAIFGTTVEVMVGTDGVRVMGLLFQSLELQRALPRMMGKPTLARIGRTSLHAISVRTPEGWLTVPCKRPGMEGVSVDHWIATGKELRRRFADEAAMTEDVVLDALRDIRAAADAAQRRAGISSPIMTADDYARFENDLFRDFGRTETADRSDGLPGRTISAAAAGAPAASTATDVPAPLTPDDDANSWNLED